MAAKKNTTTEYGMAISQKQLKAIKELKKAVDKFERGEDYGDELYAAASKIACMF